MRQVLLILAKSMILGAGSSVLFALGLHLTRLEIVVLVKLADEDFHDRAGERQRPNCR